MLTKIRNISLIILLAYKVASGQVPPWTVVPTANSQTIVVKKFSGVPNIHYDGSFSPIGDAIGVFYDQSGVWKCGGYLQLDGNTTTFTVYGNDAVDNGFQTNESFHLKYWHKSSNCEIDNPFGAMDYAQYFTGSKDTIISIFATPASVKYPQNYYCKNDPTILPILLQLTGTSFSNLSISTMPFMNGYDPATGNIESLANGDDGTFIFTIAALDNKCLRSPTMQVTVSSKLLSSSSFTVTQPDCIDTMGKVILDTATILNGTKPFVISLKNTTTNATVTMPSGVFNEVPVGNYQLIIQDQILCADTINLPPILAPTVDCDKVSDVLAPLLNTGNSVVFLPWIGLTKIYSSQGHLIHSFTTPAIWDGKDQNGQYVPTGAYFIFTEGKKKKEITVVY